MVCELTISAYITGAQEYPSCSGVNSASDGCSHCLFCLGKANIPNKCTICRWLKAKTWKAKQTFPSWEVSDLFIRAWVVRANHFFQCCYPRNGLADLVYTSLSVSVWRKGRIGVRTVCLLRCVFAVNEKIKVSEGSASCVKDVQLWNILLMKELRT